MYERSNKSFVDLRQSLTICLEFTEMYSKLFQVIGSFKAMVIHTTPISTTHFQRTRHLFRLRTQQVCTRPTSLSRTVGKTMFCTVLGSRVWTAPIICGSTAKRLDTVKVVEMLQSLT